MAQKQTNKSSVAQMRRWLRPGTRAVHVEPSSWIPGLPEIPHFPYHSSPGDSELAVGIKLKASPSVGHQTQNKYILVLWKIFSKVPNSHTKI